eukprot:TRINITY_DN6091_c3_g1_i1.p1 TRINITY_DN6091_c3_g1~~TRINITY_DN6091_c3_g1_i1.p1  ORF type:complete len:894 (+),score=345.97 TRINITY_DN6091_c3_g1_i1:98-2779(+)
MPPFVRTSTPPSLRRVTPPRSPSGSSAGGRWSYSLDNGPGNNPGRRASWGSSVADSTIDSARSGSSQWSDGLSRASSRMSEAWSASSRESAPPRRLTHRGTVLCGGPDDEGLQDFGVRTHLRLRPGEPPTVTALAALVRKHVRIAERMLLRLLRALAPGERPRVDDEMPHKARRAVSAYGVAGDSLQTAASAAAALVAGDAAQLTRFVRDCLRICDGIDAKSKELADKDLRTWVTVFDLQGILEELPPPRRAAPRAAAAASKLEPERMVERRRLHAANAADVDDAEVPALVQGLRQLVSGPPNAVTLAAAMTAHPGLAERFLLRVLAGLAPEGTKCARLHAADDRLPGAARNLLRSYAITDARTIAEAAEVLGQGASAGRFARDALRVCDGLSATAAELLTDDDLATLVRAFELADVVRAPPCRSGCRTCWSTMNGGAGPAMRSEAEVSAMAGANTTWAAQILSAAPKDAPEHLQELHDLERQERKQRKRQAKAEKADDALREGDAVILVADVAAARELAAAVPRLGWSDDMAQYCGQRGHIKRLRDKDRRLGRVQILHDDQNVWTWPLAACIRMPAGLVPLSPVAQSRKKLPAISSPVGGAHFDRVVADEPGEAEEEVVVGVPRRRPKRRPPEPQPAPEHRPSVQELPPDEQARLDELRAALPQLRPPPLPTAGAEALSPPPVPPPPPPPPAERVLRSCLKQAAPQPKEHRRPDGGATRLRLQPGTGGGGGGDGPTVRSGETVTQLTAAPDAYGMVRVRTAVGEGWIRARYLQPVDDGAAAHAAAVLALPLSDALAADVGFKKLFGELADSARRAWVAAWGDDSSQQLLRHVTDCVRAGLFRGYPQGWPRGGSLGSEASSIVSQTNSARSGRSKVSFAIERDAGSERSGGSL